MAPDNNDQDVDVFINEWHAQNKKLHENIERLLEEKI